MKSLVLGGLSAAGILMSIGLAQAADLGPPPPNAVSWNGVYAGVNAGYGWGSVAVTNFDEEGTVTYFSNPVSGFLAGGQLGYNWQSGSLVFGPEFDLGWLGLSGSTTQAIDHNISSNVSGGLYGDITGRIGIASGKTLFYAKGGWAFFNGTVNVADIGDPDSQSTSNTSGWTIGAGIEHKFSPHWSGKLEYQYFSFNNDRLVMLDHDRYDNVLTASTVKVGLNYGF